jgi:hypothetical protein
MYYCDDVLHIVAAVSNIDRRAGVTSCLCFVHIVNCAVALVRLPGEHELRSRNRVRRSSGFFMRALVGRDRRAGTR